MKKYIKKPRQRFKELRELKGTQLQVALDMGLTETTVRHLESGYADPSVKTLFAFANYFGTDVYDLWPDLACTEEHSSRGL
jgi:putative transcriptional regulator